VKVIQFHEFFFIYLFLLGNQKKAQESHDENVKMVEDALKEKEQVFTQSCSNVLKNFYWQIFFFFQLESDYEKYKKDAENEIEKLTAKNAANSESEDLPWETDPELRDMTAVELRAILADDLTEYQKAKLNSMCVQELEKELKTKTAAESSHIWEISNLQKELKKAKIKAQMNETNKNNKKAAGPATADNTARGTVASTNKGNICL